MANDKIKCQECLKEIHNVLMVKCPVCDILVCQKCSETYLLTSTQQAHCLKCKGAWSRKFIIDNFPSSFKLFSIDAKIRWLNATALSLRLPDPINMAISSASLSVLLPFCNIFSLGLSSSLQFFIEKDVILYFKIYGNKNRGDYKDNNVYLI